VRHGAARLPEETKNVTVLPSTVAGIALLIWHPSRSDSSSKRKLATEPTGFILALCFTPHSSPLSLSRISVFEQLRTSSGLVLTWSA
jgi:hypothetical protein